MTDDLPPEAIAAIDQVLAKGLEDGLIVRAGTDAEGKALYMGADDFVSIVANGILGHLYCDETASITMGHRHPNGAYEFHVSWDGAGATVVIVPDDRRVGILVERHPFTSTP